MQVIQTQGESLVLWKTGSSSRRVSCLNERAVGVTREIHGKQFVQPEIVKCTSRRVAKKSRSRSEAARYDD